MSQNILFQLMTSFLFHMFKESHLKGDHYLVSPQKFFLLILMKKSALCNWS